MDLSIDLTLDPPTGTVAARGDLDIFSANDVAISLREAVARGCSRIVIDVSGVSFVDASALGVFARAHASVAADGGTMEFVEASPQFVRLCSIIRLDRVFGLPDDDRSITAGS
ncbi:STAS domain-containing protein [Nocardioides sp. URHA0020]|uniref:STAS domain-containing protein n=1 Tax=Nocardioides sp. URHA0020 TaxID=1380392 RepID=UPI00048DBD7A|nr:STAS domain-containing protein [Nocardioides sp. URHA0020]